MNIFIVQDNVNGVIGCFESSKQAELAIVTHVNDKLKTYRSILNENQNITLKIPNFFNYTLITSKLGSNIISDKKRIKCLSDISLPNVVLEHNSLNTSLKNNCNQDADSNNLTLSDLNFDLNDNKSETNDSSKPNTLVNTSVLNLNDNIKNDGTEDKSATPKPKIPANIDKNKVVELIEKLRKTKEEEEKRLKEEEKKLEKEKKKLNKKMAKENRKRHIEEIKKERMIERKRKFEHDKQLYLRLKEKEIIKTDDDVPELFKIQYPVLKEMDEKGIFDTDNEFDYYDKTLPKMINYGTTKFSSLFESGYKPHTFDTESSSSSDTDSSDTDSSDTEDESSSEVEELEPSEENNNTSEVAFDDL